MAMNLIESVQQKLGYPPLKKIDPNTQDVVETAETAVAHTLEQAAIPSVLTAFFKYVELDEGATAFIEDKHKSDWIDYIFGDNKNEVLEAIAKYANASTAEIIPKLNAIADETVMVAKEALQPTADVKAIRLFFNDQKNNTLLYLPAELNMGNLLNDGTLDDQTNKMEGPISSLLKSIGTAFSTPVTSDEKS